MSLFDKVYKLTIREFEGISMSNFLLTSAVGSLLAYAAMMFWQKKSGKAIKTNKKILCCLLMFYLSFIIQMTIARRASGSIDGGVTTLQEAVTKFRDKSQMLFQVLNIILFIPYGALLSGLLCEIQLWKRRILILGLSYILSITIEVVQWVSLRGYFEAIDLLMNVLGGMIGYAVVNVILKTKEDFSCEKNNKKYNERKEKDGI